MITHEELDFYEDSLNHMHPGDMVKMKQDFARRIAETARCYLDLFPPTYRVEDPLNPDLGPNPTAWDVLKSLFKKSLPNL